MVRGSRIRALHVSKRTGAGNEKQMYPFLFSRRGLKAGGLEAAAGGGSAVAAKGKTLLGPCLFGSLDARRNAMAPGIFLG